MTAPRMWVTGLLRSGAVADGFPRAKRRSTDLACRVNPSVAIAMYVVGLYVSMQGSQCHDEWVGVGEDCNVQFI